MNAYHLGALYAGVALTLFLPAEILNAQTATPPPLTATTTIFAGTMQHCSSLNLCTNASLSALGMLVALQQGTTSLSLQTGPLASLLQGVQMGEIESQVEYLEANVDIRVGARLTADSLTGSLIASGIQKTRLTAGINLTDAYIRTLETSLDVTSMTATGSWTTMLHGGIELASMRIGGNPLTGHFAAGSQIPVSGAITLPAINLGPLSLGSQQQLFTGTMTVQQPSQVVDPADSDFLIQSVVPLLISGVAPDGLGGAYTIEFRIGETAIRKSLIGAGGVRISPATITFDPTGLAGLTILPPTH